MKKSTLTMQHLDVRASNRWYPVQQVKRCSTRASQQALLRMEHVATDFIHMTTPMPAFDQTCFHVSSDGRELLVAATLRNSMGPEGLKESVDIFFDPYHDHLGFFQFSFAPGHEPVPAHHLPYMEAASTRFPWVNLRGHEWKDLNTLSVVGAAELERWLFARFEVSEIFPAGSRCGFNFARYRSVISEATSWNLSAGNGFVDAMSFGHLYLHSQPIEVGVTAARLHGNNLELEGVLSNGVRPFDLELRDPFGTAQNLKIEVKGAQWQVRQRLPHTPAGRYRLYPRIEGESVEPEFFAFDLVHPKRKPRFSIGMFYDVPDDLRAGYYSPERLEQQIATLADWGIDRLYWIDYGNTNRCASFWHWASSFRNARKTSRHCGDLLPLAADLSHRRGMEFYGVYKIFDLGFTDAVFDKGAKDRIQEVENRYAALLEPVAASQPLTMRSDPRAFREFQFPITELKISSELPMIEVPGRQVRLWISSDNHRYKPYGGKFTVRQGSERLPHCRWTPIGVEQEKGKRPSWFFQLSNLHVEQPYIALEITGQPLQCVNRVYLLIEAADGRGRKAPVVVSDAGGLREGFTFGKAWPGWANHTPLILKKMKWNGSPLGIAFWQRESMPQMLEPMHTGAKDIWLAGVRRLLDAGVDGVDIRILCHHVACRSWLAYAFAEPVREAFRALSGREFEATAKDYERLRLLRGEAITHFLREAKQLTCQAGKKLCAHLECGVEVPPVLHQRMEMHLDWKRWIEERIVDELTAKYWGSQSKFMQEQVLPLAKRNGVPIHICDLNFTLNNPLGVERAERLVREACEAGFAGYAFYETACYLRLNAAGVSLPVGHVDQAIRRAANIARQ